MTFVADSFVAYKVPEGGHITIDCSTVEPAYYSALSFHHSSVPPFYLAPDGKKFIQQGQVFTITNVTEQDNGNYSCLVKDKNLQSTVLQVAEINIIPCKYFKTLLLPRVFEMRIQDKFQISCSKILKYK